MTRKKVEKTQTLKKLEFREYKLFQDFEITFGKSNILVGPNNSGKSTVLGAIRLLNFMLRRFKTRIPELISQNGVQFTGWRFSLNEKLPINHQNVHRNLKSTTAEIIYTFSDDVQIHVRFPDDEDFYAEVSNCFPMVTSTSRAKEAFPIDLMCIPRLGSVEQQEKELKKATVEEGLLTNRASSHFRNFWYHYPQNFDAFQKMLSNTWPGMEIEQPTREDIFLNMVCRENRMPRELFWIGNGFQIWCQLLTYIAAAVNDTTIVVDEPEVYLHPDLQRKLTNLLNDREVTAVVATHSPEIINEADPSNIIIVDSRQLKAKRIRSTSGQQTALDFIGSLHNLALTRIAKNKRIVFVEGQDEKILMKIAKACKLQHIKENTRYTCLPIGGFTGIKYIESMTRAFKAALGDDLRFGVILDKDYRWQEEVDKIVETDLRGLQFVHVHDRKEIENYLIDRSTILEACRVAVKKRDETDWVVMKSDVEAKYDKVLESFTTDVMANYASSLRAFNPAIAPKTSIVKANDFLKSEANAGRLHKLVCGKEFLGNLSEWLQKDYKFSLSAGSVCHAINSASVDQSLIDLDRAIKNFVSG